jgi:iron complex transport system substrate-binding protein
MKIIKLITVLMLILSGCVSQIGETAPTKSESQFPVILTNNYGKNVTINNPPTRIVSLAPSNTEILFSLGLGEKVVGVTEYDNYPEEATQKEMIGGFTSVNIEKVLSLNPDLVLATGGVQIDVVEKLRDIGLKVVVIDARNLGEVLENIMTVGKITGSEKEAQSLNKILQERITTIKFAQPNKRPKVVYVVWGDPLMVAGPDTFANDLIETAGGENVFSDAVTQYPQISMESVVERNPEIIITGHHSQMNLTQLKDEAQWKEIRAVKNNRLHTIDADIVSRAGPRIVEALEQFASWIK